MPNHLARARIVAQQAAAQLIAGGAEAVVLVGSVARGDALPTSDIDLVALGDGPAYRLHMHEGYQISTSWRTPDAVRAGFHSPSDAGGAVPAWRGALILADPVGAAARLQAEAHAWDWSLISAAADAWVADQVTGFAEEVHRLVGQSTSGSPRTAAVMRALLAVRLPMILAVHHRILYDTENRLWDLVAEHEGPHWTLLQDRALGLAAVAGAAVGTAPDPGHDTQPRPAPPQLGSLAPAAQPVAHTTTAAAPRPADSAEPPTSAPDAHNAMAAAPRPADNAQPPPAARPDAPTAMAAASSDAGLDGRDATVAAASVDRPAASGQSVGAASVDRPAAAGSANGVAELAGGVAAAAAGLDGRGVVAGVGGPAGGVAEVGVGRDSRRAAAASAVGGVEAMVSAGGVDAAVAVGGVDAVVAVGGVDAGIVVGGADAVVAVGGGDAAALGLYGVVAARTAHLLDDEQRAVVHRALGVMRAIGVQLG